jgi:hypothetical protein
MVDSYEHYNERGGSNFKGNCWPGESLFGPDFWKVTELRRLADIYSTLVSFSRIILVRFRLSMLRCFVKFENSSSIRPLIFVSRDHSCSAVWSIKVSALSGTGIVDSNSSRGTDICLRLFCVRSGLVSVWSPFRGVPPTLYKIHNFRTTSEWEQPREPTPSRYFQLISLTTTIST